MDDGLGPLGWLIACLVGLVLIIGFIGGCAAVTSYKGVEPGKVGIIQQGGPFDGRGIAGLRKVNSSPGFIGAFNSLHQYPATQRNYIISNNVNLGDRKGADKYCTPSADAVQVCIEAQAYFTLNTQPTILKQFYRKYGQRVFEGLHPSDGENGWASFLDVNFRPTLENALGNTIAQFNCAELNSLCALVKGKSAQKTDKQTAQNRIAVQNAVQTALQKDLNDTLGGDFFKGIRFRLQKVNLDDSLNNAASAYNAAKINVQTQQVNTQAAQQEAQQAQARANAYRANPYAGLAQVVKDAGGKIILNIGGKSLGLNLGG